MPGMDIDARLADLGWEVPAPFTPVGEYINAVRSGDLVVLGGHVPVAASGDVVLGRLGDDLTVEDGRRAARWAALSALASLRDHLGSLDAVQQVVSLRGLVNATPDFVEHTAVIDGASEVFVTLYGDRGRHARIAFGVASLPVGLALEIELTVLAPA